MMGEQLWKWWRMTKFEDAIWAKETRSTQCWTKMYVSTTIGCAELNGHSGHGQTSRPVSASSHLPVTDRLARAHFAPLYEWVKQLVDGHLGRITVGVEWTTEKKGNYHCYLISGQLLSPYFATWCSRPLVPRKWIWCSRLVDARAAISTLGCEEQMSLAQNRKVWGEGVGNKDRRNRGWRKSGRFSWQIGRISCDFDDVIVPVWCHMAKTRDMAAM